MTRYIFQGACQSGRGHLDAIRRASCALGMYSCCAPVAVVTTASCPACRTSACCCCRVFTAALQQQVQVPHVQAQSSIERILTRHVRRVT